MRAAILGPEGTRLTGWERDAFRDASPWGFILFARNLESADQIRRLCDDLRAAAGHEAPIFIDQEGGRVARLRPPLVRDWRPPLEETATRAFWLRYRIIAAELRALGITGNCAPMADIATDQTHPVVRNRCYGTDPGTVSKRARAVADGLIAGGVWPVLKHIPGHGRPSLDSHVDLPRVSAPLPELETSDFAPFRALGDLPLGMTAHVVYDCLDPSGPVTTSAPAIRFLRENLGVQGALMSDDLSMQALSGDIASRTRAAMAAGCDLALHCNGDRAEIAQVLADCGEAGPRVPMTAPVETAADIPALIAEYEALR